MSLPHATIVEFVKTALAEDLGSGDLCAALLPQPTQVHAQIRSREQGVLCGSAFVNEVFHQCDQECKVNWFFEDSALIEPDTIVCEIYGKATAVLQAERTALNFLQLLSGVATQTHTYVQAIAGTYCQILDTRKTLPGLRLAQKYAVSCGGGINHRFGLYDQMMLKENHIHAVGSIVAAVERARQLHPNVPLIVEVENVAGLQEALSVEVKHILLDNFSLSELHQAVEANQQRAKLEASGGITLKNITEIAQTGVDYISVGSLTKNVQALDLSLRLLSL